MLEVRATRPDYWKAENLDVFNGRGWALGNVPGTEDASSTISGAALARWTQTIQVTVRAMATTQVIAAGSAGPPTDLSKPFAVGENPGTWTADGQLGPGDSYSIRTYSPHPSDAELAGAGTAYPAALLPGYLTMYVPGPSQLPGLSAARLGANCGRKRAAGSVRAAVECRGVGPLYDSSYL